MDVIKVSGSESKRALSEYLQDGLPGCWLLALEGEGEEGDGDGTVSGEELGRCIEQSELADEQPLILETNAGTEGLDTLLEVMVTDRPPAATAGWPPAEVVLVQLGEGFAPKAESGLEKGFKQSAGAHKVLIYSDEDGRERAFRKVLDIALSRIGGSEMPEEVPAQVVEAVKREASEGKITCDRAHEMALELGVPVGVVGRALDLAGIKITKCQLGCF